MDVNEYNEHMRKYALSPNNQSSFNLFSDKDNIQKQSYEIAKNVYRKFDQYNYHISEDRNLSLPKIGRMKQTKLTTLERQYVEKKSQKKIS